MAFQSCSVPIASHSDSVVLSIDGLCNRFANRRLANTRWSNEAQDFSLDRIVKLSDGNEFQNTLLNFFHSVMALIQNGFGNLNVEVVLGVDAERHLGEVLKIRFRVLVLAILSIHLRKALQLFLYDLHYFIRNRLSFDVLHQVLNNGLLSIIVLVEILLQTLVDLLQLLLRFLLVFANVVVLLELSVEF